MYIMTTMAVYRRKSEKLNVFTVLYNDIEIFPIDCGGMENLKKKKEKKTPTLAHLAFLRLLG